MTLAALRKERKISQATVAEALGIGQMQISRLEKRKDPRLATMARTIAAMGGHLTMIATFPDQEPVILRLRSWRRSRSGPEGRAFRVDLFRDMNASALPTGKDLERRIPGFPGPKSGTWGTRLYWTMAALCR